MPRGGGGRGSGGRGRSFKASSKHSPAAVPSPAPPPAKASDDKQPVGGHIGQAFADGLGLGAGNAIAHRAFDAVFGPRVLNVVTDASPAASSQKYLGGSDACAVQNKAFQDCLSSYGSDISKCQFYIDMLSECRRNSGSSLSA